MREKKRHSKSNVTDMSDYRWGGGLVVLCLWHFSGWVHYTRRSWTALAAVEMHPAFQAVFFYFEGRQ